MTVDAPLALRGTVVTPSGVLPDAVVRIRGERIVSVDLPEADGSPQADGVPPARQLILPGAIDAHVHCYSEPAEGFANATRAAAAGGVTTVVEMPYDVGAPVNSLSVLEEKKRKLDGQSYVDVALLGTIMKSGGLSEIERLANAGVCGFKLSMFETDPDRFPRIDYGELREAFRIIRETGLRVGLHAEDGEIVGRLVAELRTAGRQDAIAHCESRPPITETLAVAAAIELAHDVGVKLHIYHASLPRTFLLVQAARQAGLDITAETCPHYLSLSQDDMQRLGAFGKINPPLRQSDLRPRLWRLLADGAVDLVASDHSPWSLAKKQAPDIFENASGAPGVETLLPILLDATLQNRLSLERLVALTAAGPAAAFGLAAQKGRIEVGADADLVVVDPHGEYVVSANTLHSSAGWTPYEGMRLRGRITQTLVRGAAVYRDGEVLGDPGHGRFVGPSAWTIPAQAAALP